MVAKGAGKIAAIPVEVPTAVIEKAGAIKFNVACIIAGAEGTENGKPMRAGFVKCTGVGAGKSVGGALRGAGLF